MFIISLHTYLQISLREWQVRLRYKNCLNMPTKWLVYQLNSRTYELLLAVAASLWSGSLIFSSKGPHLFFLRNLFHQNKTNHTVNLDSHNLVLFKNLRGKLQETAGHAYTIPEGQKRQCIYPFPRYFVIWEFILSKTLVPEFISYIKLLKNPRLLNMSAWRKRWMTMSTVYL